MEFMQILFMGIIITLALLLVFSYKSGVDSYESYSNNTSEDKYFSYPDSDKSKNNSYDYNKDLQHGYGGYYPLVGDKHLSEDKMYPY